MSDVAVPFVPRRLHVQQERQAATATPRTYPARVARLLALAHSLQKRVTSGEFRDYYERVYGKRKTLDAPQPG